MKRVSVCMATYNGELFLREQLNSILEQIGNYDEVVIVDDCSQDRTINVICAFNDERIRLIRNEKNLGVNKSFEIAAMAALGEYIFLSDQDDIWIPGRVEELISALRHVNGGLVVSNYIIINKVGEYIGNKLGSSRLKECDNNRCIINLCQILIGKKNYFGCAMAMTSGFRDMAFPLPKICRNHDLWLAILGNVKRCIIHLNYDSLYYRQHGNNFSQQKRSLSKKIRTRFELLFLISYAVFFRKKLLL